MGWIGVALVLFALWVTARRDWVRLTRASVRVPAKVVGHSTSWDDGQRAYAARLVFDLDGQSIEVVDQVFSSRPNPPIGAELWLNYPIGRPDLARIPRPVTWLLVYAALLTMLVLLGMVLWA